MNELIGRNVKVMGSVHQEQESRTSGHQRLIEAVTRRLGRPVTVYLALAAVLVWVIVNAALPHAFDPPPFPALEMLLSLAAFLTTLMVLSRQNRESQRDQQRAHLQLQVNLLTEQKIAKLIGLVEELRRDLPDVADREDLVAAAMAQTADPLTMLTELEKSQLADMRHL